MKMKKTFRNLMSIILITTMFCWSCYIVSAENISSRLKSETFEIENFNVISKNTITGEITVHQCDTSLTTNALNSGITVLSTPAYEGIENLEIDGDIIDDMIIPNQVIGDDTRYQITNPNQNPYKKICRIIAHWDTDGDGAIDLRTGGTGFLVGPDVVVTAGHMVYSNSRGWCEYVEMSFAQNGTSRPYGTIDSTMIYVAQDWIDENDSNEDWAVIETAEDIGNTVGWLGKKWQSTSLNGTSVNVTGYPGDKTANTMWRGNGTITSSTSGRLGHSCDTFNGQSGAPVLNGSNQVLAIHIGGNSSSGYGTRMTQWLFNYLEEFV